MKMELQVTSFEISKKLKELGVEQKSLFKWCHVWGSDEDAGKDILAFGDAYHSIRVASAFSVAELGEMLPGQITNSDPEHPIHQYISEKSATQWHSVYVCAKCMGRVGSQWADTEADARAKMLIYLLETNLIHSLK